jgi:integrase
MLSPEESNAMARREWQNPSVLERTGAKGREWYIRYRYKVLDVVDGKPVIRRPQKFEVLGLCSEMGKRAAERKKDEIMREINNQAYTIQSHIPFADFVVIFRKEHLPYLAKPTRDTYEQQIRTRLLPAFAKMKLCDVTTLEIQRLMTAMEHAKDEDGNPAPIARTTRHTVLGILGSIFRCAQRWHYIETRNPIEDVHVGGGPARVRECRVPSMADVQRLMDAVDPEIALLIETLCTTGMRISEAAGWRAEGVDVVHGVAKVTRRWCRGDDGATKSEAGVRELPLGSLLPVFAERAARLEPNAHVFTWKGEPIQDNTLLANYLSPIMKRLGIKFPGFGWHTFRRLHLSLMQRQGMSLFDMRRQAGHGSVKTTQMYVADDLGERSKAVESMQRGLKLVRKQA